MYLFISFVVADGCIFSPLNSGSTTRRRRLYIVLRPPPLTSTYHLYLFSGVIRGGYRLLRVESWMGLVEMRSSLHPMQRLPCIYISVSLIAGFSTELHATLKMPKQRKILFFEGNTLFFLEWGYGCAFYHLQENSEYRLDIDYLNCI